MKETRLGPRRWALVVMTGGALIALPFTQRSTHPAARELTQVDPLADLTLEALLLQPVSTPQTTQTPRDSFHGDNSAGVTALEQSGIEPTSRLPAWALAQQTPFEELVHQQIITPVVEPPRVLPLQPLRPWISPPPDSATGTSSPRVVQAGSSSSAGVEQLVSSPLGSPTPWAMDEAIDEQPASNSLADGRIDSRQLSVTAWPDERFAAEHVARQVAPPRHPLQSAIVSADQMRQPATSVVATSGTPIVAPPSIATPSIAPPAITRQLGLRPAATVQVQFGQTPDNPHPLPKLPDERKGHLIVQPLR